MKLLTRNVGRATGEEEGVLPSALADPGQLLQVEHFTDRHAPQRKQILVVEPAFVRRPGFESRSIAAHSAEVIIVQKVHHFFGLFDPNKGALCWRDAAQSSSLGLVHLIVGVDPAASDEQNITILKLNSLLRCTISDSVERDSVCSVRVILHSSIVPVINQYPSTDSECLVSRIPERIEISQSLTNPMIRPGLCSTTCAMLDFIMR